MFPRSWLFHLAGQAFVVICAEAGNEGRESIGEWGDTWVSSAHGVEARHSEAWRTPGVAQVFTGKFDGRTTRSVILLDGIASDWRSAAFTLHRRSLRECMLWGGLNAEPGMLYNSYRCELKSFKGGGRLSHGVFDSFRKDEAVKALFAEVYGVDADRCVFGRGFGPLLVVQNRTMVPDSAHEDICKPSVRHMLGISVITYPHDDWGPQWLGHFEVLQAKGGEPRTPVLRFSPQPNRTVVFDGCIEHRATNPAAASAPLREGSPISPGLSRIVGERGPSRSDFREWRFAFVLQLYCPYHSEEL
mmetsp:Transcript_58566/g.181887  ORF Transcript_58566/g.181887 Transcript_58566/m.181887 type:complete len:302 (+) Transcript_58566:108-1013(+)